MAQNRTITLQNQISKAAVELLIILAGSCFLALLSQVAIPLPMTPVPMTLQTLGVFLLAAVLGSRRAAYSVLAYLIQGTCALPVFAGGIANPLWFLEPKAGFLASFAIVAFLIGRLVEKRRDATTLYFLCAFTLGQLVIFAVGMLWLALYVGMPKAFVFGVVPFLSGAGVKICTATLLLKGYYASRKSSLTK